MPDPFLLAHAVYPLTFELGGPLSPVSIRDQMLRGVLLAERAYEEGLIDTTSRRLLVAGAGAAGATAAIRAAQLGVETLLVDRAPAPFLRQAACATRWIDPAQYDWPVSHWSAGHFPWAGPPVPLPWHADFGSNIAASWQVLFVQALAALRPLLRFRAGTTVSVQPTLIVSSTGPFIRVPLSHLTLGSAPLFGALFSAVGFGTERCDVGAYHGFNFWDNDPLEQPNAGIALPTQAAILISGGGDGGLQDTLRMIIDPVPLGAPVSARGVIQHLGISGMLDAIYEAEDQAQRTYIWGAGDQHDHGVFVDLEQVHQQVAIAALADPTTVAKLQTILRTPRPDLTLVFSCTHFSRAYALNRFLVLLVEEYLKSHESRSLLLPGHRVDAVQPSVSGSHTCGNAQVCHGIDHLVAFSPRVCFAGVGTPLAPGKSSYNVVVIRHGAAPPTFVTAGGLPVAQPRQMLPYHLT